MQRNNFEFVGKVFVCSFSLKQILNLYFGAYFPMIASSFFAVSVFQCSGAVKIALCVLPANGFGVPFVATRLTASFKTNCALRTFFVRYSTTISIETAS